MQDSTRQELFNTALSHHQAGDWVLARTTYERYLECHPDHPHALANLTDRLRALRQGLRRRMAAAPLTDEARFVEEMEQAWRGMWHLVQTTTSMPIDGLRWR